MRLKNVLAFRGFALALVVVAPVGAQQPAPPAAAPAAAPAPRSPEIHPNKTVMLRLLAPKSISMRHCRA